MTTNTVQAAPIAGETFTGISTQANQWISGGGGGALACLTAASSSAANSIPACAGGPHDAVGSGALRLTPAALSSSGFAIYNTPVSAGEGLDISFDMYQYGGNGADGIVFFLIDGSANPTQPGALGGSLGYSSSGNGTTPGLVGGYVGVGFDRWGNFADPGFGNGGPGQRPNSITVRGSESTDYQYVTHTAAEGALGVEASPTRSGAKRSVRITVSTNNIMSVAVDYHDGDGPVTELSGIDLSTINGPGSLPANFKFGFSAGTGGSTNIHEISGLTVNPLGPKLAMDVTDKGGFKQGESRQLVFSVSNDAGAESTTGDITVTSTLPTYLKPSAASGTGWSCVVGGPVVNCSRPGSGANALQPGDSAPDITVDVEVNNYTPASVDATATVTTENNDDSLASDTHTIAVAASADIDNISDSAEMAVPNGGDANNDGTPDYQQATVTSFKSRVNDKYVSLQTGGCTNNEYVGANIEEANGTYGKVDPDYQYPTGMVSFGIICAAPGVTSTVTLYFYGIDPAGLVVRKYDTSKQTYATISDAVLTSVTIGGLQAAKAVYAVADGSSRDSDGAVNGVIFDPVGLAKAETLPGAPDTGLPRASALTPLLSLIAGSLLLAGVLIRRPRRD